MTQDIFYYEAGYIDDSYFVYTADAEVLDVGSFTMDVSCGVIKQSQAELVVEVTTTVVVKHFEGTDLFAFSDSALAADVDRIRDNNIEASAAFDIAVDAVRGIYVSSQADSQFNVVVANLRIRNEEAAIEAAFSLTCTAIRAIRVIASPQVQGQFIDNGVTLQQDLYPNYSQLTLSQPE